MNLLMCIASADLSTALNSAVTNVAIALVSALSAVAIFYINKLVEKLKTETKMIKDDQQRKLVNDAIDRLRSVSYITVSAIEQTTGSAIRKANLPAKDKTKQLKELTIRACDEIWNTLEPEYQRVLQESINDLDTYMVNVIEDSVRRVKNEMK
jgi:hypothetical protein